MKRHILIASLTLPVILLLTGCVSSSAEPVETMPEVTPTSNYTPPVETITVPDLNQTNAKDAGVTLTTASLNYEYNAGEDSVWDSSNWIVQNQSPVAGTAVPSGTVVTLYVTKLEPAVAPPAEGSEPLYETSPELITPSGIDFGYATVACDNAGLSAYPYGFNAHWFLGVMGEEVQGDSYFIKASVDITNEYNAEAERVVECKVTGTPDAPVVEYFQIL